MGPDPQTWTRGCRSRQPSELSLKELGAQGLEGRGCLNQGHKAQVAIGRPWRAGTRERKDTFPGGKVRMMEIVLVEMEAPQEIVCGLGQWAPCQKVSEKLSNPAGARGRLFYLQKWDLLLLCTVKKGESGASFRKWGPLNFYPSFCGLPKATPPCPRYASGCLSSSLQGAQAPTQVGLILCPAVPELAGL